MNQTKNTFMDLVSLVYLLDNRLVILKIFFLNCLSCSTFYVFNTECNVIKILIGTFYII